MTNTGTSEPNRMSEQRVRLKILWSRSDNDPERFRELVSEAAVDELPLALFVCDHPDEATEEVLSGVNLNVELGNLLGIDVRELLAQSASTRDRRTATVGCSSEELLSQLADDPSIVVRVAVAENPLTPAEVFERLARDETPGVRGAVARNPSTPIDLLGLLAEDRNPSVHRSAMSSGRMHQDRPDDAYDAYYKTHPDGSPFLSKQRVRLKILWLLADNGPERFRELISEAAVDELPGTLLFCDHPDEVAEEALAGVNLDVKIDGYLALEVRQLFARSISTKDRERAVIGCSSEDLLVQMAKDPIPMVRMTVARNSYVPLEALSLLAFDGYHGNRRQVAGGPETPHELLVALAEDSNSEVRTGVAQNESAPVELLNQLSEDNDREVRRGVAMNHAAPVELLRVLTEDPVENVRNIASFALS